MNWTGGRRRGSSCGSTIAYQRARPRFGLPCRRTRHPPRRLSPPLRRPSPPRHPDGGADAGGDGAVLRFTVRPRRGSHCRRTSPRGPAARSADDKRGRSMPSLPTGTVTFLFTDIEGSTRLLQDIGDRYADVLAGYRKLLAAAVREWRGVEIGTQGDGCLVAFSRASDGVAAAAAAQHALVGHAWPEDVSLRVRMGLHTGEALSEAGDYVGLTVTRAARICAAAHGGQILLSHAVRVLAADDLTS